MTATCVSPQPCISLVAAMSENHVIGRDNALPWRQSADLKHFKSLTLGKPVVMGRKTFQSLGKPLPDRKNIILTRNTDFSAAGTLVFHDVAAILADCQQQQEICIIGGAEIYQLFLPFAERIYLTLIHTQCEGDAYFPEFNQDQWQLVQTQNGQADEKNQFDYSFLDYIKIAK